MSEAGLSRDVLKDVATGLDESAGSDGAVFRIENRSEATARCGSTLLSGRVRVIVAAVQRLLLGRRG